MLQFNPDANTERDSDTREDDELYCSNCSKLITRGRWRIERNDDHEHAVFNPAGQIFEIACFKEAPGVGVIGQPSNEFTWFKGYHWQIGFCLNCNSHLGWQYSGAEIFFGLIKSKLTSRKS